MPLHYEPHAVIGLGVDQLFDLVPGDGGLFRSNGLVIDRDLVSVVVVKLVMVFVVLFGSCSIWSLLSLFV